MAKANLTQKERIAFETVEANTRMTVGKYEKKRVNQLLKSVDKAHDNINAELNKLAAIQTKPGWVSYRIETLKSVDAEISKIGKELTNDLTLNLYSHKEAQVKLGVGQASQYMRSTGAADFKALTKAGNAFVNTSTFNLIPRRSVAFLANYDLQLLGSVSSQLTTGIKTEITAGVLAGDSIQKIKSRIGKTIRDSEAFKVAGKTVFKTAQHRVENIVRTETSRAMNEGSKAGYKVWGVQGVVWLTAMDERTCDLCGPLEGNEYNLEGENLPPGPPLHPMCRCSLAPNTKTRKKDFLVNTEYANKQGAILYKEKQAKRKAYTPPLKTTTVKPKPIVKTVPKPVTKVVKKVVKPVVPKKSVIKKTVSRPSIKDIQSGKAPVHSRIEKPEWMGAIEKDMKPFDEYRKPKDRTKINAVLFKSDLRNSFTKNWDKMPKAIRKYSDPNTYVEALSSSIEEWHNSSSSVGGALMKKWVKERTGTEIIFHGKYCDHNKFLSKSVLETIDYGSDSILTREFVSMKIDNLPAAANKALNDSAGDSIYWLTQHTLAKNKKIELYRGVSSKYTDELANYLAAKNPGTVAKDFLPKIGETFAAPSNALESWSLSKSVAGIFKGKNKYGARDGLRLKINVDTKDVFMSENLIKAFGLYSGEKEYVIMPRNIMEVLNNG